MDSLSMAFEAGADHVRVYALSDPRPTGKSRLTARRRRMRRTFGWMVALGVSISPQAVALVAAQVQATTGAQSGDKGKQALAFLPNEVWVHTGDSVTWTFPTDEIHTVTFLKPAQNRPPF